MLQIKRFVALGGVLLHLVSTGCSREYATGAAAPSYAYGNAQLKTPNDLAPPSDGLRARSFEAVATVAAGSMDSEADLWSGGEAGDSSDKKASFGREEAPPPPPPVIAMPNGTPSPAKPADSPQKQEPATTTPTGTKGDENNRSQTTSPTHAPMLIYTANVQMAVYEVRNSLGEVEGLARSLGGFLAKRNDNSITIRVPASKFEDALRRIEKLGDMINRDVQVEDVTEEFNDVEIRLKNARAVRDRLEQLLSKAAKVEESIQIERELERVALLIERLEGRMKFLKDRASYSTITVTFQPRSAAELGKRPFNLPVPWLYEMGLGRLLAL
jgi:Domain of unknown function (DUF4349)